MSGGDRILFVGDIQGCPEELAELLDVSGFRPGRDRLIPLGDTINRGPDSPGVLRLLEECRAEPIQGNHERAMLKIGSGAPGATGEELLASAPDWARKPGSAFEQLLKAGMWEDALEKFARMPLVRQGEDWVAVHAGLHPVLPPEDTDPEFLTHVRWCDPQGVMPSGISGSQLESPPGHQPWFDYYRGEKTVLFGHWARRGLTSLPRVWGLDSGCVFGRKLSGLWWPEQRLIQVQARREYYPPGGFRTAQS
ncbi:MAG: metallophosphoesterase [Deltaproteobacteria bacterium]|nr:metallophosphoesterase [Deltaproteobacteria bacterium]